MSPSYSRDERRAERIEAAFRDEQRRSLALGARILLAVLAIVFVWVNIENGLPAALFFYPFLAAIGLLVMAPFLLDRAGRAAPWHPYVFSAMWISLVTVTVLAPNPFDDIQLPIQYRLQFGNQVYFFLFVAGAVFTYSPRVVLWTGFVAVAAWSCAVVAIYLQPDTLGAVSRTEWLQLSTQERLESVSDPYRVHIGPRIRELLLLLFTSTVLAAFVWRSRGLVVRQAEVERERANLSRYFSANMVDELAQSDEPLEETRAQEIAVLFADIVGFTRLTSELPPAAVIALLRDFHERMAAAVFANDGTLDKFIGDGVMATFGTPRAGRDDARRALACAGDMLASLEAWNDERVATGGVPIRIGIGLHFGPVVAGDIGGPQRFEFAVVGDTVNVASRLEHLTRDLDVRIVASDSVVARARREDPTHAPLLESLRSIGAHKVRGRKDAIEIWVG